MGVREESRARTRARILAAARAEIATHGGVGLSMRSVAREAGLVSSAVYRYFETREALLTAMIIESYGNLAAELSQVSARAPARRWAGLASALRRWAQAHPHEFQLIYGTPVPGYVAPPETVPAAAAVVAPFLRTPIDVDAPGFDKPALRRQLGPAAGELGVDGEVMAAVLTELAALVGFIGLELSGHFRGTADPADHLFDALVGRQTGTLGL